jgi:hypothetical protein
MLDNFHGRSLIIAAINFEDARRPGAVEDPAFGSGLHVIHAPLPIQPDKVDAFIAAVRLDGLVSTH